MWFLGFAKQPALNVLPAGKMPTTVPAPTKKGTAANGECLFLRPSKPDQRANINVSYSRFSSVDDKRASPSNTHTSNDSVKP